MQELNTLPSSTKRYEYENIIHHQKETYLEVSQSTINHILNYYSQIKKQSHPALITVFSWIFSACIGALLGYLPDIYRMIIEGKANSFSKIYLYVLFGGVLSFSLWLFLFRKERNPINHLMQCINDELLEKMQNINLMPSSLNHNHSLNNSTNKNNLEG